MSARVRWLAAALLAASLGAAGGCGTAATPVPTPATTTTVPVPAERSGTRSTPESVSVDTTTTVITETVTLPGYGRPPILLGDMNTPEQFIIGSLYDQALSHAGFQVQLDRNIGTSAVSQAALEQGSLDLYPVYVSDYLHDVAADTRPYPTLRAALSAARRWASLHGQVLLAPTPFSDTPGVAVLGRYAAAHHLRSIADLRRVAAGLTFGTPLEFAFDPNGMALLDRAYRVVPGLTSIVNLGTQYRALELGLIQAAYVQTSDSPLTSPRFWLLADPRHVFGFGNVVPVVSARTVALEGPAFVATIDRIDALLTERAMRGLTQELAAAPNPAAASGQVANDFLEGNGLLPPPPWSTVTSTTPTVTQAVTTVTVP